MIKIVLWILSASSLIAEVYQADITPSDINSRYGSIKILDQKEKSSVTTIEVMNDDNILILERAYSGVTNPRAITLKKLMTDKKIKGSS